MSGKKRLLFYTSVFVLAGSATYGIASLPKGHTGATEAYAPATQVALAVPAPVQPATAPIALATADKNVTLAAAAMAPPPTNPSKPSEAKGEVRSFEAGDKIKLLVYERLPDAELQKYGKVGFSEQDFQQRTEMSGEFTVTADETLSIPMLGTFGVTGSTPQQLEGAISAAYEQKMKRPGFVTVTAITRPPILILGPVKTQGKVDYQPNMTVLHALALAGGLKAGMGGGDEPWEKMEQIRERLNHASATQEMSELYAQRAVLEAERDHVSVTVPDALITLVGPVKAAALVAKETERRLAIVQARQQQMDGFEQQLAAYKTQLTTLQSTNIEPYQEAVKLAETRLGAMTQFRNQGTINNVQLQAAQKELLDSKSRMAEISQRLNDARMNIARVESDKAFAEKTARSELTATISALRQQINAQQEKSASSESILRAMNGGVMNVAFSSESGKETDTPSWTYRIVRSTAQGPNEFTANDLTILMPGDLVKVVFATPNGQSSDSKPTNGTNLGTTTKPVIPVTDQH